MKRHFLLFSLLAVALMTTMLSSCSSEKYSYESVPNDPLKARIYTLENGLKVYMTVNKETPRIQTYIAVRVGGKNDPAETTGLAHYFEHLMFKGTEKFGTQNYELEKPLLDQIEQQFEVYRKTTDEAERTAIYHVIDSLSYEASKYAIPNEYDKLMAAIGANGTNAYTSFDVTCYTEDIPSNQVENWAKIQADRFENCVIRGFHTELETVYEEKNMSLTNDSRKVYETVLNALFPHHPYGSQTVLGTQEHLKNPSITNIKRYHDTWYVPNNMAICLSGDFDPDQMIALVDKYFGSLKPNANLPKLNLPQEEPINQPIEKTVLGLEAENLTLAWRLPKAADPDMEGMEVLSSVLYNGTAGLIDLDLQQQQKVLGAFCYPMTMSDYSALMMQARPKEGQSLDELKELLLAEVKKVREGDFDEQMLTSILNNERRYKQMQLEENDYRASMFVDAFINGIDWADEAGKLDRMAKLTKQDIVALANKYLQEDNYAVIYKRQGKDLNEKKISKPQITPIQMNRDTASAFLTEIQQSTVTPIEPKFLDFSKDLAQLTTGKGIPVLYKKNELNDLFSLTYLFDMGTANDKFLGTAANYIELLGTSDMTPEQVKSEFYRLACDISVNPGAERTYVTLSGLSENMPAAVALFEKLLADAQANAEVYANFTADVLKGRRDSKLNQGQNFARLRSYVQWGKVNGATLTPGEAELKAANPQELVNRIHALNSYQHRILYYGPYAEKELVALLDREHKTPDTLKEIPAGVELKQQLTDQTKVFIAPYDAKQIYMAQISTRDEKFDPAIESARKLYNEYFGGNMNAIVFQEMRERRGLAYSAWAGLNMPGYQKYNYNFMSYIATQNDKMMDAIAAFNDIILDMPQSEAAFQLAKESAIARLRTERITKENVLWSYIDAQDLGQSVDSRIQFYNDLPGMTLQDVVNFQQQWIKGRTFHYAILGDKKELDLNALRKIGPITELTTEEIFGY